MRKVAIIDYGMANLRSVFNAFIAIGSLPFIAKNPKELCDADMIVLPGVGSFGDGMRNLKSLGWVEILENEVRHMGKPFLGICLGMQILATKGMEYGEHEGLNWIPGVVDRIEINDPTIQIPHIGWNDVHFLKKDGLFTGLGNSHDFYFVHSYVLFPENRKVISGVFSHGSEYVASVEMNNICAVQFHPEKSHTIGLEVIKNFVERWR